MDETKRSAPIKFACMELKRAWWQKISIHKPKVDILTGACLLMVLMHVFVVLNGGIDANQILYVNWLGLKSDSLLEGKIWQLVSYSFLHGNWVHLFMNVVMIWLIGGRLMVILNQKKVALCMLLGSMVGGVFFVGFDLWSGQGAILVGSSGAAFALFILMACLSPKEKLILIPVRAKNMAVGVIAASLLLSLAHPGIDLPLFKSIAQSLEQMQMTAVFQVAHACHLGGGLAGLWISSRVMGKMISLDDLRKSRIH
jgi:membrane associated rhomboid family serine protease